MSIFQITIDPLPFASYPCIQNRIVITVGMRDVEVHVLFVPLAYHRHTRAFLGGTSSVMHPRNIRLPHAINVDVPGLGKIIPQPPVVRYLVLSGGDRSTCGVDVGADVGARDPVTDSELRVDDQRSTLKKLSPSCSLFSKEGLEMWTREIPHTSRIHDDTQPDQSNQDWEAAHFQALPALTVTFGRVEARGIVSECLFLTSLACVHWIQMRRTALVLGVSSILFDCTPNETSKEHIDLLP